jgi:hypothetical protein
MLKKLCKKIIKMINLNLKKNLIDGSAFDKYNQ